MLFFYFLLIFLLNSFLISSISINIHLIPHSHVDPIWKETSKEYLIKTNEILKSILKGLILNSSRTFIWESIYYLDEFLTLNNHYNICYLYENQIEKKKLKEWCNCCTIKQTILKLLQNGQLELVGGGWISHDETLTNFDGKINNYITGRRWIFNNFGKEFIPKTNWNIDSFGHSTSNSGIILGLNYTSQVFNRISYQYKQYLRSKGIQNFQYFPELVSNPFHFEQSYEHSFNSFLSLQTIILPYHYSSPEIIDLYLQSLHLSKAKLEKMLTSLLQSISNQISTCSINHDTCNIMILIGNDFTYEGYGSTAYDYIDRLIQLINSLYGKNNNSNFKLRGIIDREKYQLVAFYSTPSKYLNEKNKNEFQNSNYQLLKGKGHFIPYSDNFFNDWTGFYGTRPLLKEKIRYFENLLNRVELLFIGLILSSKTSTINNHLSSIIYDKLTIFYQKHAYSLHHDTITGTSKQYVLTNYYNQLIQDIKDLFDSFENFLNKEIDIENNNNNQNERKIQIKLGDFFQEGMNEISSNYINNDQIFYLFNLNIDNFEQNKHNNNIDHQFHHLTFQYHNKEDVGHKCLYSSNTIQFQQLHSFEFNKELSCTSTKKCLNQNEGVVDLTTSQNIPSNQIKLITNIKNNEKKNNIIPFFIIQDCNNNENNNNIKDLKNEIFPNIHSINNQIKELVDNDQKVLEELLSYLSIRTLGGGKGWHSSGAYLLRTPFNALLTGIVNFTLGFGTSFICLLIYILFPQIFIRVYRKILQLFLSSTCIKRRIISKANDDLSNNHSLSLHSNSSHISNSYFSYFSSGCTYICSVCQKITPLLLCWICVRISVIFLMFTWIYIQTPSIWSTPIIPFNSFLSLYTNSFFSFPFLAGFLLNIWALSVVSVVLYSSSNSFNTSITSFSQPSPSLSPSSPFHCLTSIYVLYSPYFTTLLFILIVFIMILISSILSFFLSPELQSYSYLCNSYSTNSNSNINVNSNLSTSINFQTGSILSELSYNPCRDNSIFITLRKYKQDENIEIEILSRVKTGNDLLLRIDLDYWENLYWKSIEENNIPLDDQTLYETRVSDGWWEIIRNYQWLSPLSANFLPVSQFLKIIRYSPPPSSSSSSPLSSILLSISSIIKILYSSIFPNFIENNNENNVENSNLKYQHYDLLFSPLYPTGMVQYNNKLECLIHRSHKFDDEKGLEEGVIDSTRSRFLLRIKYNSSKTLKMTNINKLNQIKFQSNKQLIISSSLNKHQYLGKRLSSIVNSLHTLQKNSIHETYCYLNSILSLPSEIETNFQVKKMFLYSKNEICIIIESNTTPFLSSIHRYSSSNNNSTNSILLCTLDCLYCSWDDSISYFLQTGLISYRIRINNQ